MALKCDLSAHSTTGIPLENCYVRFVKEPEKLNFGAGWMRLFFEFFADEAAKDAGKDPMGGIEIAVGVVVVNFDMTETIDTIISAGYDKVKNDPVTWPEFADAVDV